MDFSFVQHETHRRIVASFLAESETDPSVIGVLLEGSLARGDASAAADVDLRVLLRDGMQRPFRSELREGVRVEVRYADFDRARARLRTNVSDVYAYLDGRILCDTTGRLSHLVEMAQDRVRSYTVSPDERRRLAYWLMTAREKVAGAMRSGDPLKAALIASASTWQILEGLWAVNGKPVPPVGSILAHLGDLGIRPDDADALLQRFLLGTSDERLAAAAALLEWLGQRFSHTT